MTFLKWTWAIYLCLGLVLGVIDGPVLVNAYETFSRITLAILAQNFLVIVVILCAVAALYQIKPLRFSWLMLFSRKATQSAADEDRADNLSVAPMRIRYFGAAFGALLFVNIPTLALWEEKLFRLGVTEWSDAIKWSLIFGLAHCISGVPLAAGLALSIAGMWFHWQCFEGGVTLSSLHHTAYNAILIAPLVLLAVVDAFIGEQAPEPAVESAS